MVNQCIIVLFSFVLKLRNQSYTNFVKSELIIYSKTYTTATYSTFIYY